MPTPAIDRPLLPAPASRRVLLVDDDARARCELASHLRHHGYAVEERDVLRHLDTDLESAVDALVADACAAPAVVGGELARWRAGSMHPLPVIVLQRRPDLADRVVAFELGADAVLGKPVHAPELRLRLGRLIATRESRSATRSSTLPATGGVARGPATPAHETLEFGGWRYESGPRRLRTSSGLVVTLSLAEGRLLAAFLRHPRHALARDRLLDLARGEGVTQLDRSIDLLVSRLRQKLAPDAHAASAIRTVRGIGYLFDAIGPVD